MILLLIHVSKIFKERGPRPLSLSLSSQEDHRRVHIAWDLVHHRGVPLLNTSRLSSRSLARFDPHPSLLRIDGVLVEDFGRVRGMHYWHQLDQSNS